MEVISAQGTPTESTPQLHNRSVRLGMVDIYHERESEEWRMTISERRQVRLFLPNPLFLPTTREYEALFYFMP